MTRHWGLSLMWLGVLQLMIHQLTAKTWAAWLGVQFLSRPVSSRRCTLNADAGQKCREHWFVCGSVKLIPVMTAGSKQEQSSGSPLRKKTLARPLMWRYKSLDPQRCFTAWVDQIWIRRVRRLPAHVRCRYELPDWWLTAASVVSVC